MFDGKKLKQLRESSGHTVEIVADALKTGTSMIWRWENNEVVPRQSSVEKMAAFFQVPASYFEANPSVMGGQELTDFELRLLYLVRSGNFMRAIKALTDEATRFDPAVSSDGDGIALDETPVTADDQVS